MKIWSTSAWRWRWETTTEGEYLKYQSGVGKAKKVRPLQTRGSHMQCAIYFTARLLCLYIHSITGICLASLPVLLPLPIFTPKQISKFALMFPLFFFRISQWANGFDRTCGKGRKHPASYFSANTRHYDLTARSGASQRGEGTILQSVLNKIRKCCTRTTGYWSHSQL